MHGAPSAHLASAPRRVGCKSRISSNPSPLSYHTTHCRAWQQHTGASVLQCLTGNGRISTKAGGRMSSHVSHQPCYISACRFTSPALTLNPKFTCTNSATHVPPTDSATQVNSLFEAKKIASRAQGCTTNFQFRRETEIYFQVPTFLCGNTPATIG